MEYVDELEGLWNEQESLQTSRFCGDGRAVVRVVDRRMRGKGFFDNIPQSLVEAARIDGCSRLGIFRRIVVPLSKPVIMVMRSLP